MRSFLGKIILAAACGWGAAPAWAVTVETWTEEEPKEFEKGKCDRAVISSLGRILLGRDETEILETKEEADFVNALAQGREGEIYAATGPNGRVYRIVKDKADVLCTIKGESNLFSLLIAADGSLLVGTGGSIGRVYRVSKDGQVRRWFDPDATVPTPLPEKKDKDKGKEKKKAVASKPAKPTTTTATTKPTTGKTPTAPRRHKTVNYIWAMARGAKGQVYAATGAEGQLLEIDADGRKARVVFDSKESNLLSLAVGKDGRLYTGSDKKGLVYRVDPTANRAFVMYDTGEAEISAIVLDEAGNVYAATAAAAAARPGKTAKPKPSGRPGAATKAASSGKTGRTAVTRTVGKSMPRTTKTTGAPSQAKEGGNAVYRIAPDGMVTEVFREPVMILDMVEAGGSLFLGTGDEGRVYEVRPAEEEQISLAKVKDKQVTAILRTADGRLYLGTSNQGRVLKLSSGVADKGTFVSQTLDAKQISRWGRVRWEGKLPDGTAVSVATRSGNVSDPEEGTWEGWSEELDARQGAQMKSTSARFLQYRLTLTTNNPKKTPMIRQVTLAHQSNNLPPKVTAVEVGEVMRSRPRKSGSSSSGSSTPRPLPPGTNPTTRIIKWKAEDANGDQMRYDVYFRMIGHPRWILLKEDNKTSEFKWDTSKVADGRYEIRVVAKDEPSNPPLTALATDRISDILVIDNSPPSVEQIASKLAGKGKMRVHAVLVDGHSPVSAAQYAVDSSDKWVAVLAEDDLFDSPRETISFVLEDLEPGEHVVTIRARDDADNTGYATTVVNIAK